MHTMKKAIPAIAKTDASAAIINASSNHNGLNTQTQDQTIWPVSFKPIKSNVNAKRKSILFPYSLDC